jgi:hypothetical protein
MPSSRAIRIVIVVDLCFLRFAFSLLRLCTRRLLASRATQDRLDGVPMFFFSFFSQDRFDSVPWWRQIFFFSFLFPNIFFLDSGSALIDLTCERCILFFSFLLFAFCPIERARRSAATVAVLTNSVHMIIVFSILHFL